jgi:hypothetical protein
MHAGIFGQGISETVHCHWDAQGVVNRGTYLCALRYTNQRAWILEGLSGFAEGIYR